MVAFAVVINGLIPGVATAQSATTNSVHAVNMNNIGTQQYLLVGDQMTVTLPDYFDGGYAWTVSNTLSSGLVQVSHVDKPPVYPFPHMVGGTGTNIWTFSAQSVGAGTVTFTGKQGSRTAIVYSCPYTIYAISTSSNAPSVSIVFKTSDPVPGGTTNDHFASFGNPAFNDYNQVAFQATVNETNSIFLGIGPVILPGSSPITNWPSYTQTNAWGGIWAQDASGNLQLVVRSAPLIADIGGFTSFSDPVYNNSNAVAFIGSYRRGFVIPLSNSFTGGTGVWTSASLTNPLNPVAYVGQPAPGIPTPYTTSVGTLNYQLNQSSTNGFLLSNKPVTFTNPVTFSAFNQIALPDQGGAVILATVTTTNFYYPTPSSNGIVPLYVAVQPLTQQGIWAQDTLGNLKLIACQGGTLNVGGTNKTIATISFLNPPGSVNGQTRNFSQDSGNMLYLATFTDWTQAGVKVVFP